MKREQEAEKQALKQRREQEINDLRSRFDESREELNEKVCSSQNQEIWSLIGFFLAKTATNRTWKTRERKNGKIERTRKNETWTR